MTTFVPLYPHSSTFSKVNFVPQQQAVSQSQMISPILFSEGTQAPHSAQPLLNKATAGPPKEDVSWIKVVKFALSLLFCQVKAWMNSVWSGSSVYKWSNKITDRLTLGGIPLKSNVDKIAEEHDVIISLTEEFELRTTTLTATPVTPEEWALREGKVFKHFPAPDFKPVPIETLEKVTVFMHETMGDGKKVYVHCKAGVGRSAMATICYFIRYEKFPADAAIDHVKKLRPSTNLNKAQVEQIYEFARVQDGKK